MNDMERQMALIQAAVSNQARENAANIATLGELAALLRPLDASRTIVFYGKGVSGSPGTIDSYRGYYEFPAIDWREDGSANVGELFNEIESAIGATFTGYKGGNYPMTRSSPLWVSGYGNCTGLGIVGVDASSDPVKILVEKIDD